MTLMEIEEKFTKTVPSCNDCAAKIVRTRNPRTRKGVRMTCPAFPKKIRALFPRIPESVGVSGGALKLCFIKFWLPGDVLS